MTPFICRHLFGWPRTTRNLQRTRERIKDAVTVLGLILSAIIGAALAHVITHLAFVL